MSARNIPTTRRLLFRKLRRPLWQRLRIDTGNRAAHVLQDQHTDPAAAWSRDIEGHPAIEVLSLRERGTSESSKRLTGIPGEHDAGSAVSGDLKIVIGHDIPVLIAQSSPHGQRRRSWIVNCRRRLLVR